MHINDENKTIKQKIGEGHSQALPLITANMKTPNMPWGNQSLKKNINHYKNNEIPENTTGLGFPLPKNCGHFDFDYNDPIMADAADEFFRNEIPELNDCMKLQGGYPHFAYIFKLGEGWDHHRKSINCKFVSGKHSEFENQIELYTSKRFVMAWGKHPSGSNYAFKSSNTIFNSSMDSLPAIDFMPVYDAIMKFDEMIMEKYYCAEGEYYANTNGKSSIKLKTSSPKSFRKPKLKKWKWEGAMHILDSVYKKPDPIIEIPNVNMDDFRNKLYNHENKRFIEIPGKTSSNWHERGEIGPAQRYADQCIASNPTIPLASLLKYCRKWGLNDDDHLISSCGMFDFTIEKACDFYAYFDCVTANNYESWRDLFCFAIKESFPTDTGFQFYNAVSECFANESNMPGKFNYNRNMKAWDSATGSSIKQNISFASVITASIMRGRKSSWNYVVINTTYADDFISSNTRHGIVYWESFKSIYEQYCKHEIENGRNPISKKKFGECLKACGYESKRINATLCYNIITHGKNNSDGDHSVDEKISTESPKMDVDLHPFVVKLNQMIENIENKEPSYAKIE